MKSFDYLVEFLTLSSDETKYKQLVWAMGPALIIDQLMPLYFVARDIQHEHWSYCKEVDWFHQ